MLSEQKVYGCIRKLYEKLGRTISVYRIMNELNREMGDEDVMRILGRLVADGDLVKSQSGYTPANSEITE